MQINLKLPQARNIAYIRVCFGFWHFRRENMYYTVTPNLPLKLPLPLSLLSPFSPPPPLSPPPHRATRLDRELIG